MQLSSFEVSSVQFSESGGFWLGAVKLSFKHADTECYNHVVLTLRFQGSKAQTFEEVEAQFLDQARNALSQASRSLADEDPDTLRKGIAGRAEIAEQQAEVESAALIDASFGHPT